MPCPHCATTHTTQQAKRTSLGYRTFRCRGCKRNFNERTATPFNYLTFPTDIVLQVVLWRLRYKLSFRDLAELFLERGFVFTHEVVREWQVRFAPLLADQLRAKRHGQAGRSWYVDETYLKVNGQWCYLYRAIDRDGNLVDSMLSATRDMNAAQRFFRQASVVAGQVPERVTTDGHTSYPRAIRETLGEHVDHHCNQYLNNRLEQDHRDIKQRYYPMRGFGSFEAAAWFCRAFDELRQFERYRRTRAEAGSLAERRQRFVAGTAACCQHSLDVQSATRPMYVPSPDTTRCTAGVRDGTLTARLRPGGLSSRGDTTSAGVLLASGSPGAASIEWYEQ